MGKSLIITTSGGTDTSDGNPNANPRYILEGYTVYNFDGELVTGQLKTVKKNSTVDCGVESLIPAGYYEEGTSIIRGINLSEKTPATATATQVLKDRTGWSNGSKITGSMVSQGKKDNTLSANGTYTIPAGWHNGSGKITQFLSTQAATNTTPGTAQKTVIAASKWSTGSQVVVGDGNLVAGNIKNGVTIFGVTGTFHIDNTNVVTGIYLIKDGVPIVTPEISYGERAGSIAAGRVGEWQAEASTVKWYPITQNGLYVVRAYDVSYATIHLTGSNKDWDSWTACVYPRFKFKPVVNLMQDKKYSVLIDVWSFTPNQILNPHKADCVNSACITGQMFTNQDGLRISGAWENYYQTRTTYATYMSRYNADMSGIKISTFPSTGHHCRWVTPKWDPAHCPNVTAFIDEVKVDFCPPYYVKRSGTNADDSICPGRVWVDYAIKNLWIGAYGGIL